MDKSIAEKMVAAHYRAALKSTYSSDGVAELEIVKADLIKALTAPSPKEADDDFLTVRDQFAMAAMQGEFSSLADPHISGMGDPSKLAERSYVMADAMLEERAKHNGGKS